MLTYDTAFELSRQRIAASETRASLLGSLGDLPRVRMFRPFRRTVNPLLRTFEVRHAASDKERMRRRLMELAENRQRAS
ncbi:MAG: hypothetical protein AB7J35_15695 [Dehalococcoidia bacterium]